MPQLVYSVLMLVPLVVLPVIAFAVSTPLGFVVGVVSLVLAIPVVVAVFAHFDLLRMKLRYGLSDEEVAKFSRLVPYLARSPESGDLRSRGMKRSVKQAAADMILADRNRSAGRESKGEETAGGEGRWGSRARSARRRR